MYSAIQSNQKDLLAILWCGSLLLFADNKIVFQHNIDGIAAPGSKESSQSSNAYSSINKTPLLHQYIKCSKDANAKQIDLKYIDSKAPEEKDARGIHICDLFDLAYMNDLCHYLVIDLLSK